MTLAMYAPIHPITQSSLKRIAKHKALVEYELDMARLRHAMPSYIREQEALVARLSNILYMSQPRQARFWVWPNMR